MKARYFLILILMVLSIVVFGVNPENNRNEKKIPDTSKQEKSDTISKKIAKVKNLENDDKKYLSQDELDNSINKLDNSINKIHMILYVISGVILLVIILLSIIYYRYINKEIDNICDKLNSSDRKNSKLTNDPYWEFANDVKKIKKDIDLLKDNLQILSKEEKSSNPHIDSNIIQSQSIKKNKFLYAESPDELIFSRFGKEPTGIYLYTIDTSKNTYTIDESLKNVVITYVDKFKHACIIEGNTSNFSRYEIKEGKVKKIDDNSWDIIEKIKLKLY